MTDVEKPTDKMWVITKAQIEAIRKSISSLAYEKVEPIVEALAQLKPLKDYLEVPTNKTMSLPSKKD